MSAEGILFLNFGLYLIGTLVLLAINDTIFKVLSAYFSIFLNVLGILFSLSLQMNAPESMELVYSWIRIGDTQINHQVLLNQQSLFMHLLVQVIALFVQLFSSKYMKYDEGINRFFAFINLFVFAMLGMVLAGNLLQCYFFWELVGFCSYLLIGFWYEKKTANAAAFKAFIMNRVGDAFFLVGILLVYTLFKTLNFEQLDLASTPSLRFYWLPHQLITAESLKTTAILLIFVGIAAKSAQFPLHVWLPDAMEGPTPASALIHAATMVVAGVFLLGRLSPIISPEAGFVIALVGAFTSVIAGFSAIFQYDIKKVLAYSTISQLGIMVAAMGMGAVGAALFHLTTHAFFKSGLFLSAAVVIKYFHHEQDMRKMGNLTKHLPIVFAVYVVCAAALVGLPFTSGYLSKEAIFNAALVYGYDRQLLTYKTAIPILLGLSSFLTTYYVVRQCVMVFFERQENPVGKIIDYTKKSFEGAIKSFQDILNAENNSKGEGVMVKFFQSLEVFEFSVLSLGAGSLFVFFSQSPWHFHEVWFLKTFAASPPEFEWLPFGVGGLTLLALAMAYNTTTGEVRRFYIKEPTSKFNKTLYRIGNAHFYIDKFYTQFFTRLMVGRPTANMQLIFNNEPDVHYQFTKGLSRKFKRIEEKGIDFFLNKIIFSFLFLSKIVRKVEQLWVDGAVVWLSTGIKKWGNSLRKLQAGQLQGYILGMVLVVITVLIIKSFIA